MAASKTLKSTDRQNIIKKLTIELKKRYKGNPPKSVRSVMETLIFATCLEDSSFDDAEHSFQQLLDAFFDLNEIRVSSIDEIKRELGASLRAQDWKAFRLREALQDIFEKHFSFDLDGLKRKTLEAAQKELTAIPHQTPFAVSYTLQACCGAHIVPIDESMFAALVWLGLTEPGSSPQQAAEELKTAVKKADAIHFCFLLKELAVDPKLSAAFSDAPEEDTDPFAASKRLATLIKDGPPKPSAKKTKAKAAAAEAKVAEAKSKPVAEAKSKPSKPATAPTSAAKAKVPAKTAEAKASAKVDPKKKVVKKKPQPKPLTKKPSAKPVAVKKATKVTKKKPVKKAPTRKPRKS